MQGAEAIYNVTFTEAEIDHFTPEASVKQWRAIIGIIDQNVYWLQVKGWSQLYAYILIACYILSVK